MQAEHYDAEQRKHTCGHAYEVCGDSEKVWYPQRHICYVEMETAGANWRYDERHKERQFHDGTFPEDLTEWSAERDAAHPFHFKDGVVLVVAETDLRPDDRFLNPANPADSPL